MVEDPTITDARSVAIGIIVKTLLMAAVMKANTLLAIPVALAKVVQIKTKN